MVGVLPRTREYQIQYGNLILAKGLTRAECIEQLSKNITVSIFRNGYTQEVYVECPIWVTPLKRINPSYSLEFTREQILNEQAYQICDMAGYVLVKII